MKSNKGIKRRKFRYYLMPHCMVVFYLTFLICEYKEKGAESAIRMFVFIVSLLVGMLWIIRSGTAHTDL